MQRGGEASESQDSAKLRGKRGRKHRPGVTPMVIKDKWARKKIEELQKTGGPAQASNTLVKKWVWQNWNERWRQYIDSVPVVQRTPAHNYKLRTRGKLHEGFCKAESALAIQLRTEKIGLAAFLYGRRVPGVLYPACQCGWRRQDPKHIVMFCPDHASACNRYCTNFRSQRTR